MKCLLFLIFTALLSLTYSDAESRDFTCQTGMHLLEVNIEKSHPKESSHGVFIRKAAGENNLPKYLHRRSDGWTQFSTEPRGQARKVVNCFAPGLYYVRIEHYRNVLLLGPMLSQIDEHVAILPLGTLKHIRTAPKNSILFDKFIWDSPVILWMAAIFSILIILVTVAYHDQVRKQEKL